MAKQKELNEIKKGTASFTLVGKATIGQYTFGIDLESKDPNSDWVYSKMNLGVDCGTKYGTIYSDLQGGYGTDRDNVVYVHGKKKNDAGKDVDDFKNMFTVAWEDREDEEVLETVGDMSFITVGLEKDDNNKIIYKKFIAPYDAVKYIEENLEADMIVKVKGNLSWKEYNGNTQMNKEITGVYLVDKKEEEFEASFIQTLLVNKDGIGKLDKDTMTISVDTYVVDHVREYKGQKITKNVNGKVKKGTTLPLMKTFEVPVSEETKEKVVKMLKLFKAKPKKVTQITVEGFFSRGDVDTTSVTMADIPDDIKELIELGYVDEKEILDKVAFANGSNKPEKMFIKSPSIRVKKGEMPSIDRVADMYDEDDINIDLILEGFDTVIDIAEEGQEVDLDAAIDGALDEDTEEEDWLAGL